MAAEYIEEIYRKINRIGLFESYRDTLTKFDECQAHTILFGGEEVFGRGVLFKTEDRLVRKHQARGQ